jgi:hypothetical protein
LRAGLDCTVKCKRQTRHQTVQYKAVRYCVGYGQFTYIPYPG